MVTNNAANIATGATSTVLTGQGVGSSPTFSAAPTVTSITFGSGTALSNYAEGTWTPTLVGGSTAGTTTYTAQNGYYTRVGNMVWCTFWVQGSAATGTGNATLGGLPFTIKSQTNGNPTFPILSVSAAGWTWPAGTTGLVGDGAANTTTMLIWGQASAGVGGFLQMANAAFAFQGFIYYQI